MQREMKKYEMQRIGNLLSNNDRTTKQMMRSCPFEDFN